MTYILITYHYLPSSEIGAKRVTALANALAASGVQVHVITSHGPDAAQQRAEAPRGVHLTFIPESPSRLLGALVWLKRAWTRLRGGRSEGPEPDVDAGVATPAPAPAHPGGKLREYFFRILFLVDRHKGWALKARQAAVAIGRRQAVTAVIASGPPMSLLVSGASAAKALCVPLVADFRDPWTDYPEKRQGTKLLTFSAKLESLLERRVLAAARLVVCTAPGLAARFRERLGEDEAKVHVVTNGYDGFPASTPSKQTNHKLKILFAGEIYMNRDPFPFLEAIERLIARQDVDRSAISVRLVGRCEEYRGRSLRDWLRGSSARSVVEILPQMGREDVARLISESGLLLNFAQGSPIQIPAKTFEHMVSGREMLVVSEMESDIVWITRGLSGITVLDPRNPQSFDDALLALYRRHVVDGLLQCPTLESVSRYSRDEQNRSYLDLLRSTNTHPA